MVLSKRSGFSHVDAGPDTVGAERMCFTVFNLCIKANCGCKICWIMDTSALVAFWQPYREVVCHKMPDRSQVVFVFWYSCANAKHRNYIMSFRGHQGRSVKYIQVGFADLRWPESSQSLSPKKNLVVDTTLFYIDGFEWSVYAGLDDWRLQWCKNT